MANDLLGIITLRHVLSYSFSSKFKNRNDYMERDVLKKVAIEQIKEFKVDREEPPQVKYRITAFTDSFPNYYPYIKHNSNNKQRTIRHQYICILELNELSIDSPFKMRMGTDRKWDNRPNKRLLKTISNEERKSIRDNINKVYKSKSVDFRNKEYKKRIKQRKDSAPYLDVGDYNSREKGLNGDFYFNLSKICKDFNCLYGKNYSNEVPNDVEFPYFTKHFLRLITYLLDKKILKT